MSDLGFRGVGVALVTPFNADLSLDAKAGADLAAQLVDLGISAIIVAGTTGEAFSLDRSERVQLIKAVKEAVEVPVIAGTGAASTIQAVDLTIDAIEAGADGVLALTPFGMGDPRPYYSALREAAADAWLMGYHFPKISAPGIDLSFLDQLDIDACKDSTGDATRLLTEATEHTTPIYPGSSALVGMAGRLGMPGVILAAANAAPELCVAAFGGNADALMALAPTHAATGRKPPNGIKAATAARFGIAPHYRIG